MHNLKLATGVTLAAAKIEYPPTGGTYDVKAALTAGGGIIATDNDGLADALLALSVIVDAAATTQTYSHLAATKATYALMTSGYADYTHALYDL